MSKEGIVFDLSSVALAKLEKVEIREEKIVFRGKIVGEPIMQSFATVEKIQNYLKAISIFREAGFLVKEVFLEFSDKAVFNTNVGDVFLNPEEDMSLTAQNAVLLINEIKLKNPTIHFNYIDARFGNKIFYK